MQILASGRAAGARGRVGVLAIRLGLTILLGAALGANVAAQQPPRFITALAVGWNGMPRVWNSACGGVVAPYDDHVKDPSFELRAARHVATRLSIEARAGVHTPVDLRSCVQIVPPHPDGLAVDRVYPNHDGNASVATDLRLRYEPRAGLVVSGGGGYLWAMHAPYLAIGPGIRVGGRVRLLADGDWLVGRFPYELLTTEWANNALIHLGERVGTHEWRSVVGVRLGVELRVR